MILTHYYVTLPPKLSESHDVIIASITECDSQIQKDIAKQLSNYSGRALRRFSDFDAYLQKRIQTEKWLYEAFLQTGGTPNTRYPFYFVLGENKQLQRDFGADVMMFQLDSNEIPSSQISFTLGDSVGIYFSSAPKHVYTLAQITPILSNQIFIDNQLSYLETYHRYIEVQVWDKMCLSQVGRDQREHVDNDNYVLSLLYFGISYHKNSKYSIVFIKFSNINKKLLLSVIIESVECGGIFHFKYNLSKR